MLRWWRAILAFLNMTNDGGAYSALDEVSRSFMPIRIAEPGAVVRPSHISEFIDALLAVAAPHPFVALAPIFYNMRSWVPPERDGERSEPLKFASSLNTIIQRLNWQVAFTGVRQERQGQIKKGFTSTIVDVVNDRSDVKRVIVVIRLGSDQRCYKHGKELCLTVNVPKCVQQKFIDYVNAVSKDGKIATALELGKMRPWDPKEPWKGSDEVLVQNSPDLSVCQPTLVSSSNGKPIDNELLDLIIPHANEHSLYIDSEHSLIYIFSNVVQAKTDGLDYQRGCGGLFIVVNNKALADKELVWLHQAKSLSDKLANRIIHEAQIEEIERQSRAAAISQVLARTLSHNLGSHSLNAFATEEGMRKQFEEIEYRKRHHICLPGRIFYKGVSCVTQAIPCLLEDRQFSPVKRLEAEELSKHRRELLATYNNYLRERMDFLADITTAVPAFETRTHLVHDLLKGYADNHLLTTTIAGSPDFDYQWKVMRDGKELRDKDDILVSIPSDVLGRHAFYVILENIVRNSSKHGAHPKGEPVTYSVEVTQMTGKHADMLKVTILDDKCRPTQPKVKEPITYFNEHDSLTAEEKKGLETVQHLVAERNKNIKAEVLKDGRVRDGAWGMLEMKACAAYLRCVPLEELDERKYHPREDTTKRLEDEEEAPLLEAVCDEEGHFGFSFYVSRPKRILFTGPAKKVLAKEKDERALREAGFLIETVESIARGHDIYKHRLWCHVHTEANKEELGEMVKALTKDPARFPHQVLVICATSASPDEMETMKEYGAYLDRTVRMVALEGFEEVQSTQEAWHDALYTKCLGAWLHSAAHQKRLGYAESQVLEMKNGTKRISVDYADHGDNMKFYNTVCSKVGCEESKMSNAPIDLEHNLRTAKSKHFLVPYPSGVERYLSREMINADEQLALHHADHWLDEMVVIDERIQQAALSTRYALKGGEKVWVKHLMDLTSTWIPHDEVVDLNSPAFTVGMWDDLLGWLKNRCRVPDYAFIHLGVLEKFKSCLEGKSIEVMIGELNDALPGTGLIIISGRGKPSGQMPPSVCFTSYSAAARYITQDTNRCAYLLHELARSSRRLAIDPMKHT